ncbi:MAG: hypothetical protein EXS36_16710 [Pedosphaera sp.]|nr:hypothetical protein [Pedosphaera sp.]
MNRREIVLAGTIGGLVGLLLISWALRSLFVLPLRDLDRRAVVLREKLKKIQTERQNFFTAEDHLKALAPRTFSDAPDPAIARSGEMLTRLISRARLEGSDFTRLPISPIKHPGASEVGWSVQGEGALTQVVDLLFSAQESPYLHRVENLAITVGEAPGHVHISFRYLTLVLDPSPDVARLDLPDRLALDSPERHLLDGITQRDLLRPYIRRPPGAPENPAAKPAAPRTPPGPETFKVVSLSEWNGKPEVHVRDLTAQKTLRYQPGEAFAGGTLMMVDYRSLPLPGNPLLQSSSRAILRIGSAFWAIERGQTLADKRKLNPNELPPGIQ